MLTRFSHPSLPRRATHPKRLARVLVPIAVAGSWGMTMAAHATSPASVEQSQHASPSADDKATRDDYALDVGGTTTTLKVTGEGTFALVVTPKNGKKVHPDAPFEVTLKAPRGVKPGKTRLGRADIVNKGAAAPEVRTTLRAEAPGTGTLEASLSFFLCTDAWCQRMTDNVVVEITVEK